MGEIDLFLSKLNKLSIKFSFIMNISAFNPNRPCYFSRSAFFADWVFVVGALWTLQLKAERR